MTKEINNIIYRKHVEHRLDFFARVELKYRAARDRLMMSKTISRKNRDKQ